MAYIEVHQALRDHRKILALAAELDMEEAHVAGHCVFLWLWSLDNAEDGVLPQSERIIERAAGWHGATGVLVAALVTVGMLDRAADGSLHIHDWYDYAGRLIDRRKADADRKRAARASADVRETSGGHPADIRTPSSVPYPTVAVADPTVSNQSISNQRDPSAVVAAATRVRAHEADVALEPTSGGDDGDGGTSPDDEKPEFAQSHPTRGALALVPSQPTPAPQKQPTPETVPRTATDAQLATLEPLARQVAAAANLKPGYNLVALTRVLWTYRARDGDELVKEADKLAERRARGHSPPLTIGELDNWLVRWAMRLDETASQSSNEHETTTKGESNGHHEHPATANGRPRTARRDGSGAGPRRAVTAAPDPHRDGIYAAFVDTG